MPTPVDLDISSWTLQPDSPFYDGSRTANARPSGSVVITGSVIENQVLTATDTLSDPETLGAFSYQWHRDTVDISLATSSTYTLVTADIDTKISVTISYTDGSAQAESSTSAETIAVSAASGNYTGTFAHGNSVVISGSGFGTKPTQAAPLLWDTVDNISEYSALNDGDTPTTDIWTQNANDNVKYSTSSGQRHANSSAQYRGVVPTWVSSSPWIYQLWLEEPAIFASPWGSQNGKLYFSFWFKSSINPQDGNNKLIRSWGAASSPDERVSLILDHFYDASGSAEWNIWWDATADGYYTHQGWTRLEFWIEYGGDTEVWMNAVIPDDEPGTGLLQATGIYTAPTGDPNISFGLDVSNETAQTAMEGCEFLMSDIYIDDTWARVEVGDNAVYELCTIREPQPATAWADGSVTIDCNLGGLGTFTGKFVHVLTDSRAVAKSFTI